MQTTTLGLKIEALVCAFLEHRGLLCVTKNYRCRLGEIDLIMFDQSSETLIFVEVRYRTRNEFGNATESVTAAKQRKLKRAVLHYLQKHADARQVARIDVIGVGAAAPDARRISDPTNRAEQSAVLVHEPAFGVTIHEFEGYQLCWTRSAIEE